MKHKENGAPDAPPELTKEFLATLRQGLKDAANRGDLDAVKLFLSVGKLNFDADTLHDALRSAVWSHVGHNNLEIIDILVGELRTRYGPTRTHCGRVQANPRDELLWQVKRADALIRLLEHGIGTDDLLQQIIVNNKSERRDLAAVAEIYLKMRTDTAPKPS